MSPDDASWLTTGGGVGWRRHGAGLLGTLLALTLASGLLVGCRTPQVSRLPAAGATQAPGDDSSMAPSQSPTPPERASSTAVARPTSTILPTAVPLEKLAATLVPAADGFQQPVGLAVAEDGSGRLFVVEKAGRVQVVVAGVVWPEPFLDIRGRVGDGASEQGLLGLAFHPAFGEDPAERRFYVNYTDTDGDTVVAEYRVRPDGRAAEPDSENVVLAVAQPAGNHNGGQLAFGPDGYLYIGLGDGGGSGDRYGNAQNPATLLGKMLRLDIAGAPYGIPADNPFVGQEEWRPEIWSYGLRNPWRFSFDRDTGDLYIGDVGQASWEEVNRQGAASGGGQDYGWPILEGNHCFEGGTDCDGGGQTVRPILEYEHGAEGCAVTGGYVYRGPAAPYARGTYVFGDYCSGKIWAARNAPDGSWGRAELMDTELAVSSFGQSEDGEILVVDYDTGDLYRLAFSLARSGAAPAEGDAGAKAPGGTGGGPR